MALIFLHLAVAIQLLWMHQVLSQRIAKTYPDDPSWPSLTDWEKFNSTVEGNLIKYIDPREVCNGSISSLAGCASHNVQMFNPNYIRNDPGLISWPFLGGNDSCVLEASIFSRNQLQNKCNQKRYPAYIVAARNAKHVSEAVKWAATHNLRVVIKNTGHDFMGRNFGYGSLSIWTRHLTGLEWIQNHTGPIPARDFTNHWNGSAVKYGSGQQWGEVSRFASARNHVVVTGGESTVGAGGGWLLNGGHGPLTNLLGLGVENVLEFEVVIPSGEVVIANHETRADLFWALRGAAATTFGIVTRVTYKAFPAFRSSVLTLSIAPRSNKPKDKEQYYRAISFYLQKNVDMQDFGISGYPTITSTRYDGILQAPNRTIEEVAEFWKPINQKLLDLGVYTKYNIKDKGLVDTVSRPDVTFTGMSLLLGMTRFSTDLPLWSSSRLISRKALLQDGQAAVYNLTRNMLEFGAMLLPYTSIPRQAVQDRPWNYSLNPAWRTAVMHLCSMKIGDLGYNSTRSKLSSIPSTSQQLTTSISTLQAGNAGIRQRWIEISDKLLPFLDALSENHASYLNEASPYESNWKTTFYGEPKNYQKLVDVKRKYDPTNLLWCHICVEGDVFTEHADGKLYTNDR